MTDPVMPVRCIDEGVKHSRWAALAFLRRQEAAARRVPAEFADDILGAIIGDDWPEEPQWRILRNPQRESVLVAARSGVRPRGEEGSSVAGHNRKFAGPRTWPTLYKDPNAGHELKCGHPDCRRQWRGKLSLLYDMADEAQRRGKRELRV